MSHEKLEIGRHYGRRATHLRLPDVVGKEQMITLFRRRETNDSSLVG